MTVILFIILFGVGVLVSMAVDDRARLKRRCRQLEGTNREYQMCIIRKDKTIEMIRSENRREREELKKEIQVLHTQNAALKMVIEADRQKKEGA